MDPHATAPGPQPAAASAGRPRGGDLTPPTTSRPARPATVATEYITDRTLPPPTSQVRPRVRTGWSRRHCRRRLKTDPLSTGGFQATSEGGQFSTVVDRHEIDRRQPRSTPEATKPQVSTVMRNQHHQKRGRWTRLRGDASPPMTADRLNFGEDPRSLKPYTSVSPARRAPTANERVETNMGSVHFHAQTVEVDLARQHVIGRVHKRRGGRNPSAGTRQGVVGTYTDGPGASSATWARDKNG
jgi:hypothetical protein